MVEKYIILGILKAAIRDLEKEALSPYYYGKPKLSPAERRFREMVLRDYALGREVIPVGPQTKFLAQLERARKKSFMPAATATIKKPTFFARLFKTLRLR